MELVSLFISSLLVNNIVLSKFLGISMFVDVSRKKKVALKTGLVVVIVAVFSSILNYIIYQNILVSLKIEDLKTIIFILIIVLMELLIGYGIKKVNQGFYNDFKLDFPLITSNCMILGISLLNVGNSFSEMVVFSLGTSLGFFLIFNIFSSIKDRLDRDVPKYFRGLPISLIIAAIMALIFSRYIF